MQTALIFLIIGGSAWACISVVCQYRLRSEAFRRRNRSQEISILSEQASSHLVDCLTSFEDKQVAILNDVEKRIKDLEQRLQPEIKTTVSQGG